MSTKSARSVLRRRGSTLETALLEAAWQELREVGYKQLSFDNVARRAGTSKPVLYRRWANRLDLVRATLRAHRPLLSSAIPPNTGTLRGDVIELLEYRTNAMNVAPDIMWGMAIDAINEEQLGGSFHKELMEINLKLMKAVLQKAEARGEVDTMAIPDRLVTLPIDLSRHEMLLTGEAPTKTIIAQIVDDIFLPLVKKV